MLPKIDKISNLSLRNESDDVLLICDEHERKAVSLIKNILNELLEESSFLKDLFDKDPDINLSLPYRIHFSSRFITIEQEEKSKSLHFNNLDLSSPNQKIIKNKCIYALEEINAIYKKCQRSRIPSESQPYESFYRKKFTRHPPQEPAASRNLGDRGRTFTKKTFGTKRASKPSYRPSPYSDRLAPKKPHSHATLKTKAASSFSSVSKAHMDLSPTLSGIECTDAVTNDTTTAISSSPMIEAASQTSELLLQSSYEKSKSLDILKVLIESANQFEIEREETHSHDFKQHIAKIISKDPDLQESIFHYLYILNKKKHKTTTPHNESERFSLGKRYFIDKEYNHVKTTNSDRAQAIYLYVLQEIATQLLNADMAKHHELIALYELLPQKMKNAVEGHLWQLDGCNKEQDPLYGFKAFRELEGFTADKSKKSRAMSKTLIEIITQ